MGTEPRDRNEELEKRRIEDREFYYWAGRCIAVWAEVESGLFDLSWHALGTLKPLAAIVYYGAPTLNARLSLTDELVRAVLPKPPKKNGGHPPKPVKHWAMIAKEIRDHLSIRRRVAHHPVTLFIGTPEPEVSLVFLTGQHELARGKDMPSPIRIKDLQAHYVHLRGIKDNLTQFLRSELAPRLQGRFPPDSQLPMARAARLGLQKEPVQQPEPSLE